MCVSPRLSCRSFYCRSYPLTAVRIHELEAERGAIRERLNHQMLRTLIAVLILAAALELPARAQTVEHPATVTFDGARLVPKAGETSRVHLLGVVELYSLAVYVDGSIRDRQHVVSPDVPKALRIAITYKDDLSRRITLD
jgi:hypothetical protein